MADGPVTQFHLQRLDSRVGPIALVTIDNGADWRKPSTFGPEALESLAGVLARLRTRDWRGLVLTGKPLVFAAGADMTQFPGITPERAREGGKAGHELFGRLRELPFPTLAAVNGAALGGGLEIALHCDVRTLAANVRHPGFPEVFLGLIPAWGGTQRLPRLIGLTCALEMICGGEPITAERAAALGVASVVAPADRLVEEGIRLVGRLQRTGEWHERRRRLRGPLGIGEESLVGEDDGSGEI